MANQRVTDFILQAEKGFYKWPLKDLLRVSVAADALTVYLVSGAVQVLPRADYVAPVPVPPPAPTPVPPTPVPPAGTLAVVPIPNRQPFPWDPPFSGTLDGWDPARFNTGSGWAEFTVKLTQDAPGIWLRPHSGTDPAADRKIAGTGAALHAPIQVSGPVKAGAIPIRAQFPHGFEWFLGDFSTSPDMANAVRLPSLFGIDFAVGYAGTSHAYRMFIDGYATDAAHPAPNPPDYMKLNPFGVVNGAEQSNGDADWHLPGEAGSGCNSFYAAQLLDTLCRETGGIVSFCGYAMNGGSTGAYQVNDSHVYGLLKAAIKRRKRLHGFVPIFGPNDKNMFSADHTASFLARLFQQLRVDGNNPDVLFSVCGSPIFDGGGDAFLEGHLANEIVERANPDRVVFMRGIDCGGWSNNGHATQWGRTRYAVMQARGLLHLFDRLRGLPGRSLGPKAISATRDGAMIKVKLSGPVYPYGWAEGAWATKMVDLDPSVIPAEAWSSVTEVYPAGMMKSDSSPLPVARTVVANDAPGGPELQVTLTTDPGNQGKVLDFFWALSGLGDSIQGHTPGNGMGMLKDRVIDGGVTWGRDLQRSFHPVPVIPPNAAPTALAFDPPRDAVVGARHRICGTGSGLPAGTLQVSVNGAPPVTPDELRVRSDNTWSGLVSMPAKPGLATLALPNGPTVTVSVRSGRDRLPASYAAQAHALYRSDNGCWADKAGTVRAEKMGSVMRWTDLVGDVGDLLALTDDADTGPLLDLNKKDWAGTVKSRFNDPRFLRSSLDFEMASALVNGVPVGRQLGVRNPALANLMQGDATFVFVLDGAPFGGWFQLANVDANFNGTAGYVAAAPQSGPTIFTRGASGLNGPKASSGPDYNIIRWNATTGRFRVKSRAGEVETTTATTALAPFNGLRIGTGPMYGTIIAAWLRCSEVQLIGAELTDDQVNNDLIGNYIASEWPF